KLELTRRLPELEEREACREREHGSDEQPHEPQPHPDLLPAEWYLLDADVERRVDEQIALQPEPEKDDGREGREDLGPLLGCDTEQSAERHDEEAQEDDLRDHPVRRA